MFRAADQTGSGFLPPEKAREILETSQLPFSDLSSIWRLSDADGDGQLSCVEFICAMALAAQRRQGLHLPPELPPELVVAAATSAAQ